MDRPTGFCLLHQLTIPHDKYHEKCKIARNGRCCKHFTRAIPEWRRELGYGDNGFGVRRHKPKKGKRR